MFNICWQQVIIVTLIYTRHDYQKKKYHGNQTTDSLCITIHI